MWDGTDLEILKALQGPLYTRRRDQVLATKQNFEEVLEQARKQPDRRLEITAAFLAGWARDREVYADFENKLDAIDLKAEVRKVRGIEGAVGYVVQDAQKAWGDKLLPYCWEQVVKLAEQTQDWKLAAYFDFIGTIGGEASIEPLLWCVDVAVSAAVVDGAHQQLKGLPFLALRERLIAGKSSHQLRQFVYDDLLARIRSAGKKSH